MKMYKKHNDFFTVAILAFIIYQVATSTAEMWIALIFVYHPVCYLAVYLRRLPVLYDTYIHYTAFAFDYLATQYKLLRHKKFKQKNEASTTQIQKRKIFTILFKSIQRTDLLSV